MTSHGHRNPHSRRNLIWLAFLLTLASFVVSVVSLGQYHKSELDPPPPAPVSSGYIQGTDIPDSIILPSPVQTTIPQEYADYVGKEYAVDLRTPSNITTQAIYDPATRMYVIHTRLGEQDLVTPFMMTADEYNNVVTRRDMYSYFQEKNAEIFENKEKQAFNIFDMNFALGPLEKVFGPGGVRLTTQGSIQLSMGIKSNKTDNPALSLKSRRKTFFDFDQ